jgi:hypothetical protein
MDNYTFRREFDFRSFFPDAIVDLKKSRQFRKMSLQEKYEKYDSLYNMYKRYFLIGRVSEKEKEEIEDAATQRLMERGLQELERTLQQ